MSKRELRKLIDKVTRRGDTVTIHWKEEGVAPTVYTKPEDMSWNDFKKMIIFEEIALLKHRKALEEPEEDVTEEILG